MNRWPLAITVRNHHQTNHWSMFTLLTALLSVRSLLKSLPNAPWEDLCKRLVRRSTCTSSFAALTAARSLEKIVERALLWYLVQDHLKRSLTRSLNKSWIMSLWTCARAVCKGLRERNQTLDRSQARAILASLLKEGSLQASLLNVILCLVLTQNNVSQTSLCHHHNH